MDHEFHKRCISHGKWRDIPMIFFSKPCKYMAFQWLGKYSSSSILPGLFGIGEVMWAVTKTLGISWYFLYKGDHIFILPTFKGITTIHYFRILEPEPISISFFIRVSGFNLAYLDSFLLVIFVLHNIWARLGVKNALPKTNKSPENRTSHSKIYLPTINFSGAMITVVTQVMVQFPCLKITGWRTSSRWFLFFCH